MGNRSEAVKKLKAPEIRAPKCLITKKCFLRFGDFFNFFTASQSRRVGRVCPQAGITGTKPREAYGVRGACSRCRMCGAVRKREQAPRTPYASRDTTALVIRCAICSVSPGNLRKKTRFSHILFSAPPHGQIEPGALRTAAPYPPSLIGYALWCRFDCQTRARSIRYTYKKPIMDELIPTRAT